MKKAVIFDMDGLLIDSERATYKEYKELLKSMGLEYSQESYLRLLGKGAKFCFEEFYREFGRDIPMQQIWDEVHASLDQHLIENVPVKKGCVNLLNYLKDHHILMAVATSSHCDRVHAILKAGGLFPYFDAIVCGDEVVNGKPDPEIFLTACKKLKVASEQAIVLEDSETGILAAFNGNIDSICIPDMKYPEEEYKKKAMIVLSDLDEVISYLKTSVL